MMESLLVDGLIQICFRAGCLALTDRVLRVLVGGNAGGESRGAAAAPSHRTLHNRAAQGL